MKTYILGAGASYHAGYPLASRLGNRLADWIVEKRSKDDGTEGQLIESYLRMVASMTSKR